MSSIPSGFRELTEAIGFAAANGPWFAAIAIASSMIGTSAGKLLLERLTDQQFRQWSNRIITTIAAYYIGYSLVLMAGIA